MFQRVGPKAFKKDLSNINRLVALLNQPQQTFKSIHIAGTNGKGSVSFYLATALHQAGYKVGLYTSPHYKDYRERIRIDTSMITKNYVRSFVNKVIALGVFEWESRPSFFELTVAMAFSYFAENEVDFAVIETGLGGRLDSTNIITPEISTITNIGLDHTHFLGNTLELIAAEKAGIIKQDVPVVIGRRQDETTPIFESKSKESNSALTYAQSEQLPVTLRAAVGDRHSWQLENMLTAYVTLAQLGLKISDEALIAAWTIGLTSWGYLGRNQWLSESPRILVDSAHNQMGLKSLFENLEKEKYQQLHIILAIVGDKDPGLVLDLFPRTEKYYFSQAQIPRAMPREALHVHASHHGLHGKTYTTIPRALAAAKKSYKTGDLILVTGSIFTVAEVV